MGAAVPPGCPGTGGGVTSFPISPRLARIMVVLSFHPVSGPTLRSIYRNLFQTWLEDFPAYSLTHHHQLAKVIFIKRENVNLTIFFPQTIGIEVDSIWNWTKYYPEG